jgi:NitT/TauT family transport system substrate-binding protein
MFTSSRQGAYRRVRLCIAKVLGLSQENHETGCPERNKKFKRGTSFTYRLAALSALLATQMIFGTSYSSAQAKELRVAYQDGLAYLPFLLMKEHKLIEKEAQKAGLGDLKLTWLKFASGSVMNDALLSNSLDLATGGVPPLATIWSRSKGRIDVKGISAWASVPAYLNTRNPKIKSIKDFTSADRIAVPAVKTSNQALFLQMAAEKEFGPENYSKLDPFTVSMSHGDATTAMLSGMSEITSSFTIEPFSTIQKGAGARTITSSHEILGGPATSSVIWTTAKFYNENPKLAAAFVKSLQTAIDMIQKDTAAAAQSYLSLSTAKDTLSSVTAMLNDANLQFSITPNRVLMQVEFMHRIGAIPIKPESWRDLFFPTADQLSGS